MTEFEKSASTPAGRDRLRREAALLARARHPGVVALVRCDEQTDRTRLVMARPTDRTLAGAPPATPEDALRVLAALAATVADLHAIGIAHRRLQPDHVLLADDRPFLCGFADATGSASAEDRALDEVALRDLVDLLAAHAGAAAGRRGRAGRALRALASEDRAGALTAVELAGRAGRAIGRPAGRRSRTPQPIIDDRSFVAAEPSPPTATAAHAPHQVVDEQANEEVLANREETPVRPHGARRAARRGAPLLAVPAIVALIVVWPSRAPDHLGSAAPPPPTTAASGTTSSSSSSGAPEATVDAGRAAPSVAASGVDPVGTAPVRVDAGGATYEVGAPGDQVVVADWACTGAPTAVLLRPSTGEVFFFDALPDADLTITGRRVATVPDAREVVTDDVGASCPPLAVRDTAGTTHRIGAP